MGQNWQESYLANKPETKKSFFADDKWFGKDKIEHFICGFGGALILAQFQMKDEEIILLELTAATLWEVKDYFMDWRKWGRIGGDRFSWKDLIWTVGGGTMYVLLRRTL